MAVEDTEDTKEKGKNHSAEDEVRVQKVGDRKEKRSNPDTFETFVLLFWGVGVGPEIVDFGAASRLNPAPGGPWERPRPGPARCAPILSPVDQF